MSKNTSSNTAELLYIDGLKALCGMSALSVALLFVRIVATGELRYAFLIWNLFLAWIPALLAWKIVRLSLSRRKATSLLWLVIWVLFLPNAFYILSDLIHLDTLGGISKLYDAVLLFAFSSTGFLLGLGSLAVVHEWLRKYFKDKTSWIVVITIILSSSFAIYLGRYLRWNSWDVAVNPLGLLFDVSDRVLNPGAHPTTITTTILFFGTIFSSYSSMRYMIVHISRRLRSRD